MDWLLLMLALWIAFKAGQISVSVEIYRALNKVARATGRDPKELVQALTNEPLESEQPVTNVYLEQIDNNWLAYNQDTKEFLAQAADLKSLCARLVLNWPTLSFRIYNTNNQLTDKDLSDIKEILAEQETLNDAS